MFYECLLCSKHYVEIKYILADKTDKSLSAQWQRQANLQINAKLSIMRSEMKVKNRML